MGFPRVLECVQAKWGNRVFLCAVVVRSAPINKYQNIKRIRLYHVCLRGGRGEVVDAAAEDYRCRLYHRFGCDIWARKHVRAAQECHGSWVDLAVFMPRILFYFVFLAQAHNSVLVACSLGSYKGAHARE